MYRCPCECFTCNFYSVYSLISALYVCYGLLCLSVIIFRFSVSVFFFSCIMHRRVRFMRYNYTCTETLHNARHVINVNLLRITTTHDIYIQWICSALNRTICVEFFFSFLVLTLSLSLVLTFIDLYFHDKIWYKRQGLFFFCFEHRDGRMEHIQELPISILTPSSNILFEIIIDNLIC